ncbi:MAG: SEC-C domain-containing protein, partial [Rubrobacteridae bacterium]|nr:SEC-C domain-containing protein [Rubrobacteridae bacterium]
MAGIGRNDPCPCGSGKKYKKCCALKSYVEIGLEDSTRNDMVNEIIKFTHKYYNNDVADAVEIFWGEWDPDKLDESYQAIAQIGFFDWLIHDWGPDFLSDGEAESNESFKTLIELYLDKHTKRLSDREKTVLNRMKDSIISLFEVQEIYPEEGLLLKDLLLGDIYEVKEKSATRSVSKWDILAARLLHIDGNHIISGGVFGYPRMQKNSLLQEINGNFDAVNDFMEYDSLRDYLKENGEIFNHMWVRTILNPQLPEMCTSTGEPLLISKSLFKIKDEDEKAKVIAKLKEIDNLEKQDAKGVKRSIDRFMWYGDRDGRDETDSSTIFGSVIIEGLDLTLETNSKERLEKGKSVLLGDMDDAVAHRTDVFQDIFQAMEEFEQKAASREKQQNDEIPPEIQQKLITKFLDKQYENWTDEPIPALGNKTPNEAIKTESGKQQVI